MMLSISPELALGFGTPISNRTVPNAALLNQQLETAILERYRRGGGNQLSNIGGWQSVPDLFDWPEPAIAQLRNEMDRSIQTICAMPAMLERRQPPIQRRVDYRAIGWANVNQSGHYNMPHMHPGCDWSVVYYVATGRPKDGRPINGQIELRDPRPAAAYALTPGFNSGQSLLVAPRPGLMMIFPAWIDHWVHPFFGDGNRISIAANITLNRG